MMNGTPTDEQLPAPAGSRLVMLHWLEGGTAITNFGHDQASIYEAAIETWGDDGLVLCSVGIPAMGSTRLLDWMGSLHDLKGPRDLSAFWDGWRRLRESRENAIVVAPATLESESKNDVVAG